MAYVYLNCILIKEPIKKLGKYGCCQLQQSRCFRRLPSQVSFQHKQKMPKVQNYWSNQCDRKHFNLKTAYHIRPTSSSLLCFHPHSEWFTVCRPYHVSSLLRKDESTVEKSVKALKEKQDEITEEVQPAESTDVEPAKKSLWQRVKDEVRHYYNGFKLLFIEVRISARLLWSLLKGNTLTRREHKQLLRTTADLFRMVPFLVLILIPFMEFLLPVIIKVFPNILPSTFKTEDKEAEKHKRNLKVKLEMAKFLQDTIELSSLQGKKKSRTEVEKFSTFINKIRSEGIPPTNEEILKFSKLFKDDITLENLSRQQLQALCRVLGLTPIGPDNLLRFQLTMKLRQLLADDKMIQNEGLDTLTIQELQSAVRARGMRALGVSEQRLKYQLQQWLDLHLGQNIPVSLLLLSRAMYLPETLSTTEQLKATISALPETTQAEAKIKVAEIHGEKIDNKAKLDVIKQQEEAIQKEKKEKEEEKQKQMEVEKQKEMELEEKKKAAEKKALDDLEAAIEKKATPVPVEELLVDKTPTLEPSPREEIVDKAETLEDGISAKELEDIEAAIEEIAEEKKFNIDQEELDDLKEDVEEYREDLEDLKEVIMKSGGSEQDLMESKSARLLANRVDKLINQLDKTIISDLHDEKDQIQEAIELAEVRMRRSQELKTDTSKREEMEKSLQTKKVNIISINEMLLALKRLQKVPDDTRLQRIVEVLDEDKDGIINISHVLKVIELLGKENVKLSPTQVSDMIDLLKKEHVLEEMEKIKEKEEKQKQSENNGNGNAQPTSQVV